MVVGDAESLLERDVELGALAAAIEGAREGHGSMILIEGPAGIGKTSLLTATREAGAKAGIRVCVARGAELEREFSHGLARQLFEPIIVSGSQADRERYFEGAAGLSRTLFEPQGFESPGVPDAALAIVHGLYWLAANIAEDDPLLLAIDDLHWADPPSLRLVDYLTRRLDGLPILVAAAFRPAELGAERLPLGAVASNPLVTTIELQPLSDQGSTRLVREALSPDADEEFCQSCHAASAGNPLLLHELVREITDQGLAPTESGVEAILALGSKALARTVGLRLARLPGEFMRLAKAAAVFGGGASLREVAALSGLGQREASEAVDALYRLDILRGERAVEFVHPLIQAAVYETLDPAERDHAHSRAAGLLADRGAAPERIAAHLLLVPPSGDGVAVGILHDAARRALAGGGAEVAVSYLRRALDEQPSEIERGELLLELGSAEWMTDGEAALKHLTEALELAVDPAQRAVIAGALTRSLAFVGEVQEAIDLAERTLGEVDPQAGDLRRRFEGVIVHASLFQPGLRVPTGVPSSPRPGEDGDGFGSKALAAVVAFRDALAGMPPAGETATRARRALEGDVLLAEDNGGAAYTAALFALAFADSEDTLPRIAAGIEAARDQGSILAFAANKSTACLAQLLRGDLAAAAADGSDGLEALETYGVSLAIPWIAAYLARVQIEQGDLNAAERTLARASAPRDLPENLTWQWFAEASSQLTVLRGDCRKGLQQTLESGRRLEANGVRNPAFSAWRSRAALCLDALGEEPERARSLAAEEVELARTWGAPRALGVALRARGVLAEGSEGLAFLSESIETLEGSPAQLELARSLTDFGATLRRANRRRDAREPLRRGMERAHECGALELAERARTELRATGARPRRLVTTGVASLTPRERQVAELAAAGMTNREIAQRLFVTPRTVEVHLTSCYRNLEIRSRAQLPAALEAGSTASGKPASM